MLPDTISPVSCSSPRSSAGAGCLLRSVPPQRRMMLREQHPPRSPQERGGLQAEVIPKQPPHTRPGRRGCSCKSSSYQHIGAKGRTACATMSPQCPPLEKGNNW